MGIDLKTMFEQKSLEATAAAEQEFKLTEAADVANISEEMDMLPEFQVAMEENLSVEGINNIRQEYPNVENTFQRFQEVLDNDPDEVDLMNLDKSIETYKGTIFEDSIKESLKDEFVKIEPWQMEFEIPGGRTKPDIIFRDLLEPMTLDGYDIEKGDDLYVEAKCGKSEYLRSEMDHILDQVEGHQDKSIVVVTKDYEEIDPFTRAYFEDKLEQKQSKLVVADIKSENVSNSMRQSLWG